jgi:putative endonuclease
VAARFLEQRGFGILDRNLRTRQGEADLVCLDGETLVIVEVKSGQADPDHPPRVHVGREKQRTLLALAEGEQKRRGMLGRSVRVDVVEVVWDGGAGSPTVNHYPGAVSDAHDRRRRG